MNSPFEQSRRNILKGGAALLAASVSGLSTGAVLADKKTGPFKVAAVQTPGVYRFRLGDFLITMLSDGGLVIPSTSFGQNVPEAQVKAFLKSNLENSDNYYAHTNACLIDTGKKRILVDAGAGANFQKSAGRLENNLKAAGYKLSDIDSVILTHAHPDHAWGVLNAKTSKPVFRNADYYINSAEWDYWTQDKVDTVVPPALKSMAETTKKTLIPMAAKTTRIKPGAEILPGIEAIDTHGHTVGHISLAISSKKETLIITGDVVQHAYISFEHPEWHFSFDMDPEKAVAARKALLDRAATDQSLVAGFHLPFPGIGRVARQDKTYRWAPEVWRWDL